jgi:hypothetical protein
MDYRERELAFMDAILTECGRQDIAKQDRQQLEYERMATKYQPLVYALIGHNVSAKLHDQHVRDSFKAGYPLLYIATGERLFGKDRLNILTIYFARIFMF